MAEKKMFDLSQPLFHNCPGWPTYQMTKVQYEAVYPLDGYTAETISMNVHTGTHLDVPFHFYPEQKTVDCFPVDIFQGEAVLIDLRGIAPDTPIGISHMERYSDLIKAGDIVLLCTGWGQKRGYTKEYYYQWPYLSGEGAQWLLEKGVKGVGIDGLSVGGWGADKGPPPHELLLKHEVWLLEELNFPEELLQYRRIYLYAFPLLLKGFGGAPVRAVAMLMD